MENDPTTESINTANRENTLNHEEKPEDDQAKLQKEISDLKEQVSKNYENYLRAVADFDNFRRRSIKEREELHKYGIQNLFKEILPVLDSFEKVLSFEQTEASGYGEGLLLVKKQLFTILESHGLSPIPAQGQKFDPNVHQAISKVEKEGIDCDMVNEEFIRGYLLHDRLLRASMVSVATPTK